MICHSATWFHSAKLAAQGQGPPRTSYHEGGISIRDLPRPLDTNVITVSSRPKGGLPGQQEKGK
jgi:hypothetical protein